MEKRQISLKELFDFIELERKEALELGKSDHVHLQERSIGILHALLKLQMFLSKIKD